MKSKNKIILVIVGSIVLLIPALFFLVYFKVIPNPFVNTDDLVCRRMNVTDEEIVNFTFNGLGKTKSYKENVYIYFESEEAALEYYNYYAESLSDVMTVDGTTIIYTSPKDSDEEYSGESRKNILNKYIDFGFICE